MSDPNLSSTPSTKLPHGYEALAELAGNLRWTWSHCGDALWSRIDPTLWAQLRHPSDFLLTVSREKLNAALSDVNFSRDLDRLVLANRLAESGPAWFQQANLQSSLTCVAYFCMEFMLTEALPIYSGGLGNVAGDQLKAASDLGVPVVGVGLLYQHGYFRQVIDRDGVQQAIYPYNDPAQMPIAPMRLPNGELLRLAIELAGGLVWIRIWEVRVGRAKLYLLDANDAANSQVDRGITSELYGGDSELRLKQEILLGIGGWRLLTALRLNPEVCHLNEGHAACVVLERARGFMHDNGQPFAVALAATRVGNIFTTHTAVAAGFDLFEPALIGQYLGLYAQEQLGISLQQLLALGRGNPDDGAEPFNMANLAMRGSGAVNGVSRLHGHVSRHLFSKLFPRWPEDEVPIGHVTNGVHMPTWDSVAADSLWTEACGKDRWKGMSTTLESDMHRVSDDEIWALRSRNRLSLVDYARERVSKQMAAAGADAEAIGRAQSRLNTNALTLGFARRFTSYKRPNLLLHDPQRLLRILSNAPRPTQLILAGKAHPADESGKALIRQWTTFIRSVGDSLPVVFLSDYDMLLAERMVQGVDVWINTPRRPWEASGTSGMKVLVNGGLNFSELDGWWAEAFTPDVGWALGDGQEHGDDSAWDAAEAEALYDRLEREVIPEFYSRNEKGVPEAWVARIRLSMARLTPRFSATRAVREYTSQFYVPAASAYRSRAADRGLRAKNLTDWQKEWSLKRASICFDQEKIETKGGKHVFVENIFLGEVSPTMVRVELYANGDNGRDVVRQEMSQVQTEAGGSSGYTYQATVPSIRPASDYTVRIMPNCADLRVPLEVAWILWRS